MKIGYRDVEAMFAARFGIPEERHIAFRGRLDHLRKLGCPAGVNSGKGRPASFGWSQIVELSLALDLIHGGFAPDGVARIMQVHRASLLQHIKSMFAPVPDEMVIAAALHDKWPMQETSFMHLEARALDALISKDQAHTYFIGFVAGRDLASWLDENEDYETPILLIDLGTRISNLLWSMGLWAEIGIPAAVAQFREWLVCEPENTEGFD